MGFREIHQGAGETDGSQAGTLQRVIKLILVSSLCSVFALTTPMRLDAQEQSPDLIVDPVPPLSAPAPLVSVHGVVRNAASGEPLPHALVRIEGDADTGALSDGEGRFEIPGVPTGQQIFQVIKPGFGDPAPAGEVSVDGSGGATHNVVVAASMPELNFALAPRCSLHGRIELSSGDPAQGIGVLLLLRMVQDGRVVWQAAANVRTNSDGGYRFGNLADGVYVLVTNPAMDSESVTSLVENGHGATVARSGYASMFYPDAHDLAGAAKIHLANGEQGQANMLLTLEPFHSVSAEVLTAGSREPAPDSTPGRAGASFTAQVMDAAGHQTAYSAQYDQATHRIQALLPDGTWSLLVTEMPAWNMPEGARATPLTGSADFSVAGHALANVRVPLSAPRSSAVQLRINRTPTSGQSSSSQNEEIMVTVSQTGGLFGDGAVNMFAHGSQAGPMDASSLPPGTYWVHTQMPQRDLCEDSFTAGGVNLAHEPLVLGLSGASAPLQLTLRDDCAKLTLSLGGASSGLTPGEEPFSSVFVVPDFETTEDVQPAILRASSGGTVTLEGLTPGSYHVYSFNQPVQLEYRNPSVMAALSNAGQQITLSPGVTSSLVLEALAQ